MRGLSVGQWLFGLPGRCEGLAVALEEVSDHTADLAPVEVSAMARYPLQRKREFSTGRHLAKHLMAELGQGDGEPIPKGADGAPVWPGPIVGSVSHTGTWCVVVVALRSRYLSLGVDLEETSAISEEIRAYVVTDRERGLPDASSVPPSLQLTAVFSAKEAVFKAVSPLTREFLGFSDVAIDFDWPCGSFRARSRVPGQHGSRLELGRGWFHSTPDLTCALFVIPA